MAGWFMPYGTQPEILAYMRGVAEKYGLLPHCRLGDGVASAHWDDATSTWARVSAGAADMGPIPPWDPKWSQVTAVRHTRTRSRQPRAHLAPTRAATQHA